ncbi:MAG: hypothetical protein JO210_07510 [Acidobacteriaceae bacterium]|nr:hypothetical protein [Acidobacteriaceae bacterium]
MPWQRLSDPSFSRFLRKCRGDRTAAAALLHIGRTTLYRKLAEYGVKTSRAGDRASSLQ